MAINSMGGELANLGARVKISWVLFCGGSNFLSPCWYMSSLLSQFQPYDLCVIYHHFKIMSFDALSRLCCMSKFYPNRASTYPVG